MDKAKPHKLNIGEGYGIWNDGSRVHRHFPKTYLRAKNSDSAGEYKVGDSVILHQRCSGQTFGMFKITAIESGDFGGVCLRFKLTVEPVGVPKIVRDQEVK